MAKYIYKHDHQTLEANVEKAFPQGKPALTVTFSLRQGDTDMSLAKRSAPLNVLLVQASSTLRNIATAQGTTFEQSPDNAKITMGSRPGEDPVELERIERILADTFLLQLDFEKAPFKFREFLGLQSPGGQSAGR
jgi:hypothetical protein